MVGDDSRGWAWTRALQGLPASELHLCGDASALQLVRFPEYFAKAIIECHVIEMLCDVGASCLSRCTRPSPKRMLRYVPCAILQVQQLCGDMGEALEVRNYERFAPLAVEPNGLRGGYRRVQPGDAVVAFSRKSIFTIKRVHFMIESA